MRYLILLALVGACGTTTPNGSDAGDAGNTPDVAADAGLYLPAGYTPMAFLSATPTHTFSKATQVIDGAHDYVAVLDTDVGRIVMHLLSQVAPITCNSFVFLALNHFYDGILFHRVIDQFMAQTGDPTTLTSTNASTWGGGGCGYQFGLEVNPSNNFDGPGVVGMARTSDPNSNGSQFFITFVAYPSLNQQYTVWANVTEGLDVLPKIVRGQPPMTGTEWAPDVAGTTPTHIIDAYIGMK